MRARDVLDVLNRVAVFQAQSIDSHRRVDEIGGDLDSAISLLDFRQSRGQSVGTTGGVTQGVHRAVLDWSTGVIAKLAGALPRHTTLAAVGSVAADGHGGTSSERHARNAKRWLSDSRIWMAFVRSLGGVAATEPDTQLPQAASLGVLRAAIFAVRVARSSSRSRNDRDTNGKGDGGGGNAASAAVSSAAADWANTAIHALCGGGAIGTAARSDVIRMEGRDDGSRVATLASAASGRSNEDDIGTVPSQRLIEVGAILSAMEEDRGGIVSEGPEEWGGALQGGRRRRQGPLMRVSLDAYVNFLEEVMRGHVALTHETRDKHASTEAVGERKSAEGDAASPNALAVAALTELLRFQLILQDQQTNRRKVFASFCSKLMGPLFEILIDATLPSLRSAATDLVWDALFHEEHLDGFREALTAAEARGGAGRLATGTTSKSDTGSTLSGRNAIEGGKKKRRRKGKGEGDETKGVDSGNSTIPCRRVCYQQQLLEEVERLAGSDAERSLLAGMTAAPLLLEGYIVRLEQQTQRESAGTGDIHATAAAISAAGGKRSRSTAGGGGGGGDSATASSASASPASQMFKMWAILTSTIAIRSPPSSSAPTPASTISASSPETAEVGGGSLAEITEKWAVGLPRGVASSYMRASNSMLRLLLSHDVYRINEDWGELEFDQLQAFSVGLIEFAASADIDAVNSPRQRERAEHTNEETGGSARSVGSAALREELVKAFHSLLDLNHNILHGELRPVLRMTFEWAAVGANLAATAAAARRAAVTRTTVESLTLRTLAVDLAVSLVDTYGRLRQMDHIIQALFGAIADRPSASAAVLRGEECTAALGRAFQRLPEGQIESMWHMFATHLREGWTRSSSLFHASPATSTVVVGDASSVASGSVVGGAGGDDLLAREVDGEVFVLFVRNLHVTSSVAQGVGKLCTSLAEESLESFQGPLEASAAVSPESRSTKKKARKRAREHEGNSSDSSSSSGGGGGALTVEMMLPLRPALDVHGWLLDLDTRCRFWSEVLDSSISGMDGSLIPESLPITTHLHGNYAEGDPSARSSSDGALSGIIAAAAATATNGKGINATSAGYAATARLMKTLQQVSVHRVQQIYARLNGAAALEATTKGSSGVQGVAGGAAETGREEAETGATAVEEENRRLEEEARQLVAFACGACEPRRADGDRGDLSDNVEVSATWGDENHAIRDNASWSMMMPYLPVWVGFANPVQVVFFMDAFFSRCAEELLAGRSGDDKSSPLRLLTDASFYELESVAQCAPAVILSKVHFAVKHASGNAREARNVALAAPASPSVTSSARALAANKENERRGREGGHGNGHRRALRSSSGDVADNEERDGGLEERGDLGGSDGSGSGSLGTRSRVQEGHQALLEAACLLMLTQRFPAGFLEEGAIVGLLVAADALDAVCVRGLQLVDSLKRRTDMGISRRTSDERGRRYADINSTMDRMALVEALTALRGLVLRLGLQLQRTPALLEGFQSPGDALVRVIGVVRIDESEGHTHPPPHLLQASAAVLSFLAEHCVAAGQTKAALKAVAGLELTQDDEPAASASGGETFHIRPDREDHPDDGSERLVLLHGVLSGFVAGEGRRLAEARNASAGALSMDVDSDDDEVVTPATTISTPSRIDHRLLSTIAHIVGRLPVAKLASKAMISAASKHPTSSPALLLVWGDALRMSFLGDDAQRLIFAPRRSRGRRVARSRSQWVQDAVLYLRGRATAAIESSQTRAAAAAAAVLATDTAAPVDEAGAQTKADPSERTACCHLLRVVCGCSHLLDPLLEMSAVRDIVEAFIGVAMAIGHDRDRHEDGSHGGSEEGEQGQMQWQDEANVLQTAFCLLVQHASRDQLHEIVTTLLGLVEGARGDHGDDDGRTESASVGARARLFGGSVGGSASCGSCLADAAVTFVRLTSQAGKGAAFRAVMPNLALPLAAALCRQLRETSELRQGRCGCVRKIYSSSSISGGGGGGGRSDEGIQGKRLRTATGALDALDGLLSRQPYAAITARVVSVVFGSVEPAARLALHAAEALKATTAQREVKEVLLCFRACCRISGTVLQHYAPKVFSSTPPFAALCRSLLRLFFRLAAPVDSAAASTVTSAKRGNRGHEGQNRSTRTGSWKTANPHVVGVMSLEDQVSAASALSRVLEQFVPQKKVLKKYAVFLLLEYVSLAGSTSLEPAPRATLLAGIFAVMEACTRREMRQLHGLLGSLPTGQEMFRSLNEEYQEQHKYTGKM